MSDGNKPNKNNQPNKKPPNPPGLDGARKPKIVTDKLSVDPDKISNKKQG